MVSRVLNQILPLEIKPLKLLFMPHTSSAPDSSRDSRLIEVKKSIGPTLRESNVWMGSLPLSSMIFALKPPFSSGILHLPCLMTPEGLTQTMEKTPWRESHDMISKGHHCMVLMHMYQVKNSWPILDTLCFFVIFRWSVNVPYDCRKKEVL
jgi:hypothetical protein